MGLRQELGSLASVDPARALPSKATAPPDASWTGRGDARFRWAARLFSGVALLLLAVWAAVYLAWPFAQDHSAFAWVADVILSGGLPYRDAWEVKGPLVYYMVAVANALFGRTFWGIRLFDLLIIAAGLFPIYRLIRAFASRPAASVGVILFLLWYAGLNYENTAQPDGWAGVFLAGAAAALLVRAQRPGPVSALVAGFLVGGCTLFKPTYAMFVALPAAYSLLHDRRDRAWLFRFWGATALGFAAPILIAVAWFAAHGALGAWFEVQGVWLARVYTGLGLPWSARVNQSLQLMTTGKFAAATPFVVAGLWVVYRRSRAAGALFALWIAFAAIGVLLQGKPWPYLWLPAYPSLAVLAGIGVDAFLRPSLAASRGSSAGAVDARPFVLAAAGVLAVGTLLQPLDRVWSGMVLLRGGDAAVAYDRAEFNRYGRNPESLAGVADYIRRRTTPGDHVLMWGMSGSVNYLSNRPSPSRFGVSIPLVTGGAHPIRARYRSEFMSALEAQPPAFVVLDLPDCQARRAELEEFPEFSHFLAAGYRLERQFAFVKDGLPGCLEVLRRNAAA